MRTQLTLLFALATSCAAPRHLVRDDASAPSPLPADDLASLRAVQDGFREVARRASQSVVTVRAYVKSGTAPVQADAAATTGWSGETANQAYFGYELLNACSGFVIDASGEVLTTFHALQRADGTIADLIDIETHDSSRILVEVVGSEPTVNFAILRCVVFPAGHAGTLTPLEFGDSDALECGQWAFALGDPAGPEKFFAAGLFVAKPDRECYQDYLSAFYSQTALVVHPQAYGGPLLDVEGDVVGILAPREFPPGSRGDAPKLGLEFALPSKIIAGLRESIGKARSFQSPWLGFGVMSRAEIATVRGVEAFNALAKPKNGILIENVFTPSPASAADVRPGDFLVGFDTYKVFTPVDFQRYLYLAGIGKKVRLELFRNGETLQRELVIERRPTEAKPR